MLLGPIVGPILGGWLVDDVSWRWIFFINIPIGIAALALSLRVLPRDETSRHERFDALGLGLLSPASRCSSTASRSRAAAAASARAPSSCPA